MAESTARTMPPNNSGAVQLAFLDRLGRREVTVAQIEDITPRYRRIHVALSDPTDVFPFVRFCPSDHVKVYFPDPQTGVITSYRNVGTPDAEDWQVDGDAHPIRRDYTPRAWDATAGTLALDFVLHGHGVAGTWAAAAKVGDPLVIMGPRANWLLPENYAHYVVVGDETAIPSLARIIEEAPAHITVTALIEVADAGEVQALGGGNRRVTWVCRDTAAVAHGHRTAMETALKALELPADHETLFAFAAGEAGDMKPIRRYFRRELGLSSAQVSVDGYWKRGTADFDHHVSDEDADDDEE